MSQSTLAAACLKELEAEYTSTRKCLERIPASLFDYKPHPRSMNMGYLTLLVAEIPAWITHIIKKGEIDFATYEHFQPKSTKELVDHFQECFDGAKVTLQHATDADLEGNFSLKNNGQVLYETTKIENLTSTVNHWVHHRGQLTVYMRLNDIAVPAIYGPSADDRNF